MTLGLNLRASGAHDPKFTCVNLGEAITMKGLEAQSILLDADIGAVLSDLR